MQKAVFPLNFEIYKNHKLSWEANFCFQNKAKIIFVTILVFENRKEYCFLKLILIKTTYLEAIFTRFL